MSCYGSVRWILLGAKVIAANSNVVTLNQFLSLAFLSLPPPLTRESASHSLFKAQRDRRLENIADDQATRASCAAAARRPLTVGRSAAEEPTARCAACRRFSPSAPISDHRSHSR